LNWHARPPPFEKHSVLLFFAPYLYLTPNTRRILKKLTTKGYIRIALFVGTAISLYFVPWILVKAWILPMPETVQQQLDEAVSLGFDGIVVYIDKKGEPPQYLAAGWHNKEAKIPADPKALFKIASISKLYKAVAIAKMVGEGKLSLEKTLSEYMPELQGEIANADKITLKMMVQHRSGIPNYTNTPNYWAAPKETNEEKLKLVLGLPASFEPGQDYEYSNTNYLLIGEIMDKALGYPHYKYIQEKILDRLHLQNTFPSIKNVEMDRMMSGYHVGYPLDLKTDDQGMVASAEDVGIFLRALNDGSLFDGGEKEIYDSIYVYNHTGLVPGYQSIAKYFKDMDAVIVQFTGPTYFEGYNWNLSEIEYGRIVSLVEKD
jgi:CubicO group peptidase (beta-lactamase class C family)